MGVHGKKARDHSEAIDLRRFVSRPAALPKKTLIVKATRRS